MSFVHIRICLNKAAADQSAKDDRIRIRRDGGNLRVFYTSGESQKTHSILLTNSSLSDYISTLVTGLRTDGDPVHLIQFEFPGFPSLLYTAAALHNPSVRKALRRMAAIAHDALLAEVPEPAAAEETDTDSDSDDSTSVSSSETRETLDANDEYADLPRLVPTTMAWHHHWGC